MSSQWRSNLDFGQPIQQERYMESSSLLWDSESGKRRSAVAQAIFMVFATISTKF